MSKRRGGAFNSGNRGRPSPGRKGPKGERAGRRTGGAGNRRTEPTLEQPLAESVGAVPCSICGHPVEPSRHALPHGQISRRRTSSRTPVAAAARNWKRESILELPMKTPVIAQRFPAVQKAETGTYYWCACGKSTTQPFCDGSHKGTEFTPLEFEISEAKTVAWCQCKHTKSPPFCDGSHKQLSPRRSLPSAGALCAAGRLARAV